MKNSRMLDQEGNELSLPYLAMLAAPLLTVVAGVYFYQFSTDSDKFYTLLLLAIPALPAFHPKLLIPTSPVFKGLWVTVVMSAGLTHAISLVAYSSLPGSLKVDVGSTPHIGFHKLIPALNLAFTFAAALLAFWILSKVIQPPTGSESTINPKRPRLDRLRYELPAAIRRQRLQTLTFFFLLFIYVLYSIAFSLALHDRVARLEERPPSLQMDKLRSSRAGLSQSEISWCMERAGLYLTQRILFEPGSAAIVIDLHEFTTRSRAENPAGLQASECYSMNGVGAINACSFHNVARALSCFQPSFAAVVEVYGATGAPGAVSNYATNGLANLMELRAQQLRLKTQELLRMRRQLGGFSDREPPDVEWLSGLILAGLGSPPAWDPAPAALDTLFVKIGPLPGASIEWARGDRTPEMLDYLYFTVYTITTTGYGDIQPMDGFAKFVTSLANLYELFYIVIFLNVVISVSREPPDA